MNQTTYREYLGRLPEEDPFKICRICIQATQNLILNSNAGSNETRILYECMKKLKVNEATGFSYFMCTECIITLRKIGEFQDMLRFSNMFWNKYVKTEPSNNKHPEHEPQGNTLELIHFESLPLQEVNMDFEQSSNELKLENYDRDMELNGMELCNDDFAEMDSNTNTTVVDLKIERCCDICEEEFASKEFFEKHVIAHERSFNCAHCSMSFKLKASIILHLQQMHNEGVATDPYKWICTNCNQELSTKKSLRTHIQLYHGREDESKCPECNKTFANLKKLRWHMSVHRERPYKCTVCPRKFKNKCFLDKHSATHSVVRSYVCELCGLGLSTNNGLKRHIAGVHEMRKQKKYRRSITCTLCDVKFPKLLEAKEHFLAIHTKDSWKEFRSLCCGVCYIRFDSTAHREEHYKQYQANHDKAKTKLKKSSPRNYVSWSLTERPHECDICKNTFKTPESLAGHMQIHHNKPRPFKCEFCGSKHALAFHLRLHILRAHTAARPFSCSDCDYTCVTQTELNNHNKWHHTVKKQFVAGPSYTHYEMTTSKRVTLQRPK